MQLQLDANDVNFEGKIRGHYVYHITTGLELPTRFIFKQPWADKKLNTRFVNGEQTWTDSNGENVLCFEEYETGYNEWAT